MESPRVAEYCLSLFSKLHTLKIVIVADTHGQHSGLKVPDGDMLIHAGDVSKKGLQHEIIAFLKWFSAQPHKHKLFIAGNHDFFFENAMPVEIAEIIPPNVTYLCDSGVQVEGINIWGSPISPWFYDWAFNRHRGAEIHKHWALIPAKTDILITHGPAYGILDRTERGEHVGCEDLLIRLNEIKPRVHICGHIHESYGIWVENGIEHINASVLNVHYELVNDLLEYNWK